MYNATYIKDFKQETYLQYLRDPHLLDNLANEYLNQYNKDSYANFLAFKESLDHYILMKIKTNNKLIETSEFKNYLNYIKKISNKKRFYPSKSSPFCLYPELNTNVIFRDDEIRKLIYNTFYDDNTIENIEKSRNNYNIELRKTLDMMEKEQKLSQRRIDFVGDYIYSSRDFSNKNGEIFSEYVYNIVYNDKNITTSVEIIGGLISCFPGLYTLDEEVHNSRCFIADHDVIQKNNRWIAHSSGGYRYCAFEKNFWKNIDLHSSKYLEKSRSSNVLDLYFLMMCSFHELTHQYQKIKMEKDPMSGTGLSMMIKNILNKYMPRKKINDSEGNEKSICNYLLNHDSDEVEMHADEEGWRQTKHFIAGHMYNRKNKPLKSDIYSQIFKCRDNEEEVRTRRTFSMKTDANGNKEYYASYDIKNLIRIMREHPEERNNYKALQKYFTEEGTINVSLLFLEKLTKEQHQDMYDLELNNSGLEFTSYMFQNHSNDIKSILNNYPNLTKENIRNLQSNMYNNCHQYILKLRDYTKLNKNNLDETKHKFDFSTEDDMYNYYFNQIAHSLYQYRKISKIIKEKYPDYYIDENNYYISYFIEALKLTQNLNLNIIETIIDRYYSSGDDILIGLAENLREYIEQNNNKIK